MSSPRDARRTGQGLAGSWLGAVAACQLLGRGEWLRWSNRWQSTEPWAMRQGGAFAPWPQEGSNIPAVARRAKGYRKPSAQVPSAVEELASAEFLQRLRAVRQEDGGPQAERSEDLPDVDANWVAENANETARNVVTALCQHRFGEKVTVDEVIAGPPAAKGTEFIVTLALSDRMVFGSASSGQVQQFDRDTTTLLEQLKELCGWKLGIYRLKVQTPGVEEDLKSLEDLWRCELFPCYVEWVKGTSRFSRYLILDRNKTAASDVGVTIWRLADCSENHVKGKLSNKQRSQEFEILHGDFLKVRTHIDKKSYSRIKKAREVLRNEVRGVAAALAEPEDDLSGDPEADEAERSERSPTPLADRT
ncbi:unnamed protein product [Durusdinium trenchii]|uniref:Uncharacterized protein n=1 Tax=Durusdinium trenchii TaxID=1381693 RepID=A0ABP0I9M8_9DINO